jgi:hypothetical protein
MTCGVSPRSGRQRVAHGVSRGSRDRALTPVPSPAARERGAEGEVRAPFRGFHPRLLNFLPCGEHPAACPWASHSGKHGLATCGRQSSL